MSIVAPTIAVPSGARLVLATHNHKKVVELVAILRAQPGLAELPDDAVVTAGDLGVPEPVEDGVTFEENALIKARALVRATGLPAVADDSGLAVDVLGGSPGIFSARWAGRHGDDQANLDLLLAQLSAITKPVHRRAGFVCAAALVTPDGEEEVCRGEMRGTLVDAPRGTTGFGYDPILVPDAQAPAADDGPGNRTAAELTPEEKNAISHRGQAFSELAPAVAAALQP
jgi:XTP/dITP diphosphohydrolase